MFGQGSWMMGQGGWEGMMGGWGWLMMLVFWIGLILLTVWVVRTMVASTPRTGALSARDILDQRYARGEVTRKEYDQMKKDIAR